MFGTILAEFSPEQITQLASELASQLAPVLFGSAGIIGGCYALFKTVSLGIDIYNKIKGKNIIKLAKGDTESIIDGFADKVKTGVSVDITSQINKATNERLTELEKENNEVKKVLKRACLGLKVLVTAVSDLHSISRESYDALVSYKALDDESIDEIKIEETVAVIEKAVAEASDTSLYK